MLVKWKTKTYKIFAKKNGLYHAADTEPHSKVKPNIIFFNKGHIKSGEVTLVKV